MGTYVTTSYNPVMTISSPVNIDMSPITDLVKQVKDEANLSQQNFTSMTDKFLSTIQSQSNSETAKISNILEANKDDPESNTINKYILILSAVGLFITLIGKK